MELIFKCAAERGVDLQKKASGPRPPNGPPPRPRPPSGPPPSHLARQNVPDEVPRTPEENDGSDGWTKPDPVKYHPPDHRTAPLPKSALKAKRPTTFGHRKITYVDGMTRGDQK